MIKLSFFIFLIFIIFNNVFAKNININEDLNLEFNCKLKKKIIKNSEYNYKMFLADEVDEESLDSLKLYANEPSTLMVNGLSDFFSQNSNFETKINVFGDEGSFSKVHSIFRSLQASSKAFEKLENSISPLLENIFNLMK